MGYPCTNEQLEAKIREVEAAITSREMGANSREHLRIYHAELLRERERRCRRLPIAVSRLRRMRGAMSCPGSGRWAYPNSDGVMVCPECGLVLDTVPPEYLVQPGYEEQIPEHRSVEGLVHISEVLRGMRLVK